MANRKMNPVEMNETIAEPVVETKKPTVNKAKVVNCERLRVRQEPNGEEITQIQVGTIVKAKSTNDDEWSAVELKDGTRGFVMSKYIEMM